MNNIRRKELERAIELIEQAKDIVDGVHDAEVEAFDNLPESLQYSDKGESLEAHADALDDIVNSDLDDVITNIQDVIDGNV